MSDIGDTVNAVIRKHEGRGELPDGKDISEQATAKMMQEIYSGLREKSLLGGGKVTDNDMACAGIALEEGLKKKGISNIEIGYNTDAMTGLQKLGVNDGKAGKGDVINITNTRWIDETTNFPLVELFDSKAPTDAQKKCNSAELTDANTLYGYLGKNHKDLNELQRQLDEGTHWNREKEPDKIARDKSMNAFAEKANNDVNCPYKFVPIKTGNHDIGFKVTDKKTGKFVTEIQLHPDNW